MALRSALHLPGRNEGKKGSTGAPGRGGRFVLFGGITLAILATATFFLWRALEPVGRGAPGTVTVSLSMGGFSPSLVEVRAGEPVTLRLVNKDNQFHTDGGGWHQFAVDELGINIKVPPLTAQNFTFTPSQAGAFVFYCDVCCGGRESPFMQGVLVVRG
ncbi:Nitrous-oxide reductase [bacterium HR23]|nr:Nitrous-oxide reductase [bacterium HR23]